MKLFLEKMYRGISKKIWNWSLFAAHLIFLSHRDKTVLYVFIFCNSFILFFLNSNFFGVLEIQSKEEITNQQINNFFAKNSRKFRIISSSSINNVYNFTVLFSLNSKKLTYELVDKANSSFDKCEVIFRENV